MAHQRVLPAVFGTSVRKLGSASVQASNERLCRIVTGRPAILKLQRELAELASRTWQTGEADTLDYLTSTPAASKKIPHVLLFDDPSSRQSAPSAAVFLFEYKTPLGGTRVFASDDGTGRRNIIALPQHRARVAALASRTLFDRGAHIVHLGFCESFRSADESRDPISGRACSPRSPGGSPAAEIIAAEFRRHKPCSHAADWAFSEREVASYLPLLGTFEATLAAIGRKTRTNLRYYRRRCEAEFGCYFVAEAKPTLEEFLAFNRESTYAVSDELAAYRFHTTRSIPNCFMPGLRDRNGRWLSLVGMRRHNTFVELDWQMNRADMPASSLCTVMRSYLIEHEISLGSTRLYIEGGTPQPLRHSFVHHTLSEVTVVRRSAYVRLLERFSPILFPPRNYIRHLLSDPTLLWKPW